MKPPVATYFGCRYTVSTAARAGGGGAKVRAAWTCGPSPPQIVAPLSACAAAQQGANGFQIGPVAHGGNKHVVDWKILSNKRRLPHGPRPRHEHDCRIEVQRDRQGDRCIVEAVQGRQQILLLTGKRRPRRAARLPAVAVPVFNRRRSMRSNSSASLIACTPPKPAPD